MQEQNISNTFLGDLEIAEYKVQLPSWSIERLKTAAIQRRLSRPRSLAWAILLGALPPPSSDIIKCINIHRFFYDDLQSKLSMDPRTVADDDPLSQNDESVWNQHFCDNELKALILQDVVRTYPDEPYFRDKDIEDMMVRVLFFWARSHAHVGYRQGMHEILAPLLMELHLDRRCGPSELSSTLKCYLDESYIEHDSYMLFSAVMRGLEKFYTTDDIPTSCGRLPTSKVVHNPNEVVRYLERIREQYLVLLDSELASHLAACNITMELFGIRWLRLLFGREFPRTEVPHLWGFIFADGPLLPNIHFIIIAMLISMRTTLLHPEAGTVLSALMRPSPVSVGYVCSLALHLMYPHDVLRPPTPPPQPVKKQSPKNEWDLEQRGSESGPVDGSGDSDSEGVPEGADIARELATLALLRARLPAAAAALAQALPRPSAEVAQPLQQILQLASLLQCRNHALIDVETALEAAEGQTSEKVGRRQLVPVTMIGGRLMTNKQFNKQVNQVKEVPLQVFHEVECHGTSDLPSLDPLRLRTE